MGVIVGRCRGKGSENRVRLRACGEREAGRGEGVLVSSVAGTKAERREKGEDRANYAELLKNFASVCT